MDVTDPAPKPELFADRLRLALKHAGRTQEQIADTLAARFGETVARTTVTHWCTGRSEPGLDRIEAIAAETGVSPAWLAWGHGEMIEPPPASPSPEAA